MKKEKNATVVWQTSREQELAPVTMPTEVRELSDEELSQATGTRASWRHWGGGWGGWGGWGGNWGGGWGGWGGWGGNWGGWGGGCGCGGGW